jgi:glycosyltransferase involved in cell wall biosynthesis
MSCDVLVDMTALDTASRWFGTGRYIAELGAALAALGLNEREGLDVRALTSLAGPSPIGPLDYKGQDEPRYPAGSEVRWLMDRRTRLVPTLRRLRPRLWHATYHLGTPRGAMVPRVTTCLDLIPLVLHREYHPGWLFPKVERVIQALRFHGARRVIAISQHTADDMMRLLGVPARKVDVVYLGVDHARFRPPAVEERAAHDAVLAKYQLTRGAYCFHLGAADPRKNVDTLIEAFVAARLDGVELVLIGKLKPAHRAFVDGVLAKVGNPASVRLLGFVPDEDLPAILGGALMHPYTSSYEGFGNAPLDAMACGCPVIATGQTSIAEVVGDAAERVPARDVAALSAAIRRMANDSALRRERTAAGLARAARFTWRETALGSIASYARALRDD